MNRTHEHNSQTYSRKSAVTMAVIATVLVISVISMAWLRPIILDRDRQPIGDYTPPIAADELRVNVNTAGVEELQLLPGIGRVLSQRIVDHRADHGPFEQPHDLLDVHGIGERTLERIADHIRFRPHNSN